MSTSELGDKILCPTAEKITVEKITSALEFERLHPRPGASQALLCYPNNVWFYFGSNDHPLSIEDRTNPNFPVGEAAMEGLRWMRMVALGEADYGDAAPLTAKLSSKVVLSQESDWTQEHIRCLVQAFHPERWMMKGDVPHRWAPLARYFYDRAMDHLSVTEYGEPLFRADNQYGAMVSRALNNFTKQFPYHTRIKWLKDSRSWAAKRLNHLALRHELLNTGSDMIHQSLPLPTFDMGIPPRLPSLHPHHETPLGLENNDPYVTVSYPQEELCDQGSPGCDEFKFRPRSVSRWRRQERRVTSFGHSEDENSLANSNAIDNVSTFSSVSALSPTPPVILTSPSSTRSCRSFQQRRPVPVPLSRQSSASVQSSPHPLSSRSGGRLEERYERARQFSVRHKRHRAAILRRQQAMPHRHEYY